MDDCKFVSPLYDAVMLCAPTLRVETVTCAWPFAPTTDAPRLDPPSKIVIDPVGVPPVLEVTIAVKVTCVPKTAGFADELTAVVVDA